ncbi:MAG: glutamine-hydrolyzing GMP synthase [Clostridiales bacterium]|nr:glutamine-hydrolyzing GMP synthase [Clostridiales bacterium]
MSTETILVLDFGGQYKELIARRAREAGVYSVIKPGSIGADEIRAMAPVGIIMTGGPDSVYDASARSCDPAVFTLGIPILGICYGMQLMARELGGDVRPSGTREYGKTTVELLGSPLFSGVAPAITAVMSHTDQVIAPPDGFAVTARSADCPVAAMADEARRLFGVQFHPEVEQTDQGLDIIRNFAVICGAALDYSIADIERELTEHIRREVGDGRALLALSGGVDSSVCAALLAKAVPGRAVCVFVDHGLMRKGEGDEIESAFAGKDVEFVRVDASERFLSALAGVSDPETKRKIIGAEFINVFAEEARRFGRIGAFVQGTIYPDVVESGGKAGATIKSHHNVGGLPGVMPFDKILEPLRKLFKDEVRELGRRLGLDDRLVDRQPFPGPGLAIRVIGEVTPEKLAAVREADAIFRRELESAGVEASQYFAALTNLRSVGVMGDARTYDYAVTLRAVRTSDFMTCEYSRIPYDILDRVTTRVINEVKGVNRVLFDITGKPPATIEYE